MDDNKLFMIEGLMGRGKTLLTIILAFGEYDHVFANIKIEDEYDRYTHIKYFEQINELQNRKNKNKKACLIIDEAQKLFNKRMSMTKANRLISNFAVLSRKANVDIYFIPQMAGRLDGQLVELVSHKITMGNKRKYINSKGFNDIELNYSVYKKEFNEDGKIYRIPTQLETTLYDCIYILKMMKISYDTADVAELNRREKNEDNSNKNNKKNNNIDNISFEINKLIL